MYEYNARVVSVIDGDTIVVDIMLGFDIVFRTPLRLYEVYAPEIRGAEREAGLKAKYFLEDLLPAGSLIRIETIKDRKEKYGRYLAKIYKKEADEEIYVNQLLVDKGFATKERMNNE